MLMHNRFKDAFVVRFNLLDLSHVGANTMENYRSLLY